MHRLIVAFRAWFRILFNSAVAEQVEQVLNAKGPAALTHEPAAAPKEAAAPPKPVKPKAPLRSDALNLLAALQREARLVDFVQESLDGASDAQIGAAVRDVHRNCRSVIERMFALAPVETATEGAEIQIPAGFDPGRLRLSGNVAGAPERGTLQHHGWQATRCELPQWSGSEQSALVVAPAEVEIK